MRCRARPVKLVGFGRGKYLPVFRLQTRLVTVQAQEHDLLDSCVGLEKARHLGQITPLRRSNQCA